MPQVIRPSRRRERELESRFLEDARHVCVLRPCWIGEDRGRGADLTLEILELPHHLVTHRFARETIEQRVRPGMGREDDPVGGKRTELRPAEDGGG